MGGKVNAVIFKVFGVVDYESEVRISKFKMADPIWRSRIQYFSEFFAVINLKTFTRGFLASVMTVLKSDFKYSNWRIQYGDLAYNISVNSGFFRCNLFENCYSGVSEVGNDDSEVRI